MLGEFSDAVFAFKACSLQYCAATACGSRLLLWFVVSWFGVWLCVVVGLVVLWACGLWWDFGAVDGVSLFTSIWAWLLWVLV